MHFLIFLLSFSFSAPAALPFKELEALRRQTVVARWASEHSEEPWLQKCLTKEKRSQIISRLSLSTDNAAARWKKSTLSKEDLQMITSKVGICEARGSCYVYEVFLGAVQIPADLNDDTVQVRSQLEKKLEAMTSNSYKTSFSEIAQPCAILKTLFKKNP